MNNFGGPGPSHGRAGRGSGRQSGSRGRGRGSGRQYSGRGADPGPSSRGPRTASQPPQGRGSQSRQRNRTNPGPSFQGEYVYPSAIYDHNFLQPIVANNTNYPNYGGNQNSKKDACRGQNNKTKKERPMAFKKLVEMSRSDSVDIIEMINKQKDYFTHLLETPVDKKKQDLFALLLEIITNVSKTSFEESKKLLLLEISNSKFMDHLQLYLTKLPFCTSEEDKFYNGYYWKKQTEFWSNFMTFCEHIINVSPSTAVRKFGSLIEATAKICLEGLKEKHGFELPEEYVERMTRIRDSLKTCEDEPAKKKTRTDTNDEGEPPESFRDLSILPTPEELIGSRPYLRANLVKGAYADMEHYLDVQFRLLREDCFGPLRDGIHQFIEEPKRKKYDNIRVYHNVKFLEPFVSKQKIGSMVLLDENTMKRFKNVNWAHSKRFMFGSLVLFTKDNCKSFLIGTILERDEKYLSKRQLPVSLVDAEEELKIYNDDSYTMIECEVYFEPYYHVLKALQDPKFPEHLSMSNYIIDVQKIPEKPAYLNPDSIFSVKTSKFTEVKLTVLQDDTWPSEIELGLNSTQYDAYKLALTHEFAVIQGPPGTGKTFLGVKIAETLLKNLTTRILVICYTNHALDQFLEALLPVTNSMVRIGGRSRSKALENLNINDLRREHERTKSYFHDRRINLKTKMGELERAQARVDELTYASVLSYKSIVGYVEDCNIIQNFYRGSGIEDPLRHWLFEDMDNIEFEPLAEHILENEAGNSVVNENRHIDDDIYGRNNLIFDDLDDDDDGVDMRGFSSVTTSFSLSDTEENIKTLLKQYQDRQFRGCSMKKENDLRVEICFQYSQIKRLKDMMAYRSRAPRINLTNVQDLTKIPLIERWSLYFKWADVVMEDVKKEIKNLEKNVKSAAEAYEEARMMVDLAVLKEAEVVGMTTTGAARLRKLLAEIQTPIVVVEEAAEVLEAHIVTSLTKNCQHLILIGDHQQLRPSAAYMRLARHYELEVSLFERMIRNGVHSRRLGVQHRMRPELAALVCPHIYPELRNHPSVEEFPPVRGIAHNLFFFTHENPEQCVDDSSSRTNTFEGDMALRLANYLMQQGYQPQDVTILAAYSGQMFYLRKQRPFYKFLANVKITVLDNYQGEESKIIVLSLVRNNSTDSIGFLGTENRICVALSRAREGFYMFGNIELLKNNSPLWANIAATLAQNGSVGTCLELICSNHSDQITKVETVFDFVKAPEGGCQLDCKGILQCGHACPRVCHSYDREHADIMCTSQTCDRKICDVEDHKCPLICAAKCKPCKRRMEKSLPCGHSKVLECHVDPAASTVHCSQLVTATLPICGHEVQKECSRKLDDVKCTQQCQLNRLDCGHACRRKCHVKDDPQHKRYTCMQPCPKLKKGCTANLEDDLGDHKCRRSCFDKCVDCNVKVMKKRSGCTHKKRVECHVDVDATPCREKCARSLPCSHFCKKLCFEKCGDCKQKVKKKIPECNHEMQIECGTEPALQHCRRNCERVMTCGHVCPGRCDKPCDKTKCTKIIERSFDSPCGHKVQLPCNVLQDMTDGVIDPETLLKHCTAPCGVVLRCKHSCGGTCAGCRQGRLHAPCAAVCQQLNICGHRCKEPCSQVCPPCPKRCEVKCQHSQCGRECGAPCVPCTEPECGRMCRHSRCRRPCGAACDRAPCEQRCRELLPCGHRCRGLCGEPCPRACRVCDPENFPTNPFMLGDPYDDDDILVQLQDCPHIMDVRNLDNYMRSQTDTVQIKTCLVCRKPIVNTYRYKDLVNKKLKNDINPIKEKVYGTTNQRIKKKEEMLKKVKKLMTMSTYTAIAKVNNEWSNAWHMILNIIVSYQKANHVSLLQLEMSTVYLNILDNIGEYYVKYKEAKVSQLEPEFKSQIKLLCDVLANNAQKISEQQQVDIRNELRRINSIIQLDKILSNSCYTFAKTSPNVVDAAVAARDAVLSWRVFDEAKAVECLKKLQGAVKLSGIASAEERAMVVKAIGLKAGHWYKCPKGHFYCIGECGGATEQSKCPDCRATIGGRDHRLTAGNRHASEMDGSQFAAWSEEANNMANFNFNN